MYEHDIELNYDHEIELDYDHLAEESYVRVRSEVDWKAVRKLRAPDGLMSLRYTLDDE